MTMYFRVLVDQLEILSFRVVWRPVVTDYHLWAMIVQATLDKSPAW